jgi:TolB-like protein
MPRNKKATTKHSSSSIPLLRSHRDPSVLAFFVLAVDIDQKPFADSLTEELTNKISRIPGLGVPPPALV